MPLPPMIQAQEDEATRLFNELYGKKDDAEKGTPEAKEPENKDERVEEPVPDEVVKPQEDNALNEEIVLKENEELKELLRKKEASYKVLQGKYDAEVPRMAQEIRGLKEMLTDNASKAISEPDSKGSAGFEADLAKLREDYGDELANLINGVVDKKVSSQMAILDSKISNVTSASEKSARSIYLESLTDKVGDWREINNDPLFDAFLDTPEAYSGKTLRQLATEADARNDAAAVAKFYNNYKKRHQSAADAKKKLVSPSGSVAREVEDPVAKEIWTEREINAYYDDVKKGRFRNNPKEQALWEARINSALRDGRIQQE